MALTEVRVKALKDIPKDPHPTRAFIAYKVVRDGPQKVLIKYRDHRYKELVPLDGEPIGSANFRPTLKQAKVACQRLQEKFRIEAEERKARKLAFNIRNIQSPNFLVLFGTEAHSKHYLTSCPVLGISTFRGKTLFNSGWRSLNYVRNELDALPRMTLTEFRDGLTQKSLPEIVGPSCYKFLKEGLEHVLK